MKHANFEKLSIDELIEQFAAACLAQFNAEMEDDIKKQNKLITRWMTVAAELERRPGDQRSALLKLYDHPNVQVRLNAARLTLAVAPTSARELLQMIAASNKYPQAGDAGMCLWALDQGIFRPS